MTAKHDEPQFKLRIPAGIKARLEEAAKASGRSVSAEIVHRLEDSLKKRVPEGFHGDLLQTVLTTDRRLAIIDGLAQEALEYDLEIKSKQGRLAVRALVLLREFYVKFKYVARAALIGDEIPRDLITVLIEEPENGLHPSILTKLMAALDAMDITPSPTALRDEDEVEK